MLNSYPIRIRLNGKEYSTRMFVDSSGFKIKTENFFLETPELFQNREINEEDYKVNGNKLKFKLTGHDLEITNFDLSIKTQLNFNSIQKEYPVEVNVIIKYSNQSQIVKLNLNNEEITDDTILESAFIKLNSMLADKDNFLKSCFSCLLSGYERGGSAMFCFEKEKDKILNNAESYNYQNRYGNLKRDSTFEFNICNEYVSKL